MDIIDVRILEVLQDNARVKGLKSWRIQIS